MKLPALSVRAPWSWALAQNLKPFENRPRRYRYRGPILIHASKSGDSDYYNSASLEIQRLSGRVPPALWEAERGGIVGACMLTDCAEPIAEDDGWRQAAQYGLRIERAIVLPFRPYKGALGLFKVELTATEEEALRAHWPAESLVSDVEPLTSADRDTRPYEHALSRTAGPR